MTLGMILGIALSPIMKVIKKFRQRRKVKKILQEFANNRKNDIPDPIGGIRNIIPNKGKY